MFASDAASAARTWRPQLFGSKRARDIDDPVIEPLWSGPRVLAFIDGDTVRLTDVHGDPIAGQEEVAEAIRDAAPGSTALVEGFLTAEPIQTDAGVSAPDLITIPKPAQMMTQMIVGVRGDRRARLERQQDEARQRTIDEMADLVAFVAVDLLWLDDESLYDVPLLERKRILEAIVAESRLVRVGIHVKPPVDAWLSSWRGLGFRRMTFKAANSRYIPGQKNQGWAQAEIPLR